MNKAFFIIKNRHVEGCGIPPIITNENSNKYFGYFENEYGEQWVFVYDRKTTKGELRGGDAGWDNVFEVINGQAINLILDANERKWLEICWKSATSNI